jgi:hypothetical protein
MNNFYGHLHSRDAMQSTKHWPRPVTDDLASAGIVIDTEGRRFADEALGGIWIANAIARLPDPLGTRSSSIRRSGTDRPAAITCSRRIRLWSRPAAHCTAPKRWPRSPKRSVCRRSG